jgi:CBS domain containing-hemolysin-like protein
VGIVLARDVWRTQVQGGGELRDIVREVPFVPDTKTIEHLLREMQQKSAQLAVVIDEFGGTAGIVTIEDLVEEIVGEIVDELDEEREGLEERPDGAILVDGGFSIGALNERYDLRLPDEDYTTVGGFVLGRLGRIARVGDRLPIRGGQLRVMDMDGRRVGRLELTLQPIPQAELDRETEGSE